MTRSAKQADFDRWAKELDERWENRPVSIEFHRESGTLLTDIEMRIVVANLSSYEHQFSDLPLCRGCGYPTDAERGFHVGDVGLCCWLCYNMDAALRQTRQPGHKYGTIFEWFDAAHKEWIAETERRKLIRKSGDSSSGPSW